MVRVGAELLLGAARYGCLAVRGGGGGGGGLSSLSSEPPRDKRKLGKLKGPQGWETRAEEAIRGARRPCGDESPAL